MEIELLADRLEFIRLLAEWHQREWAYLRPGISLDDRVAILRERAGRSHPPITFVATADGALLGSAMLLPHDMDTRPQYSPWLAGVVVRPSDRQRGVGRALTQHVVREAARLGFGTLYLYTSSAQDFYSRMGWKVLEQTHYRNIDVTIMSYTHVA